MPNYNKTKIVATLGPATDTKEVLTELARNGVNVFRVNFSHADYDNVASKSRLSEKSTQKMDGTWQFWQTYKVQNCVLVLWKME